MEENTVLLPVEDVMKLVKAKTELDLVKKSIIRNLGLDYLGEELTIKSDRLIIEVMKILEPALLADILECEKDMKAQEKLNEIRAKELETIEKNYAITKDEAERMSKEEKEKFTQEIAEAIGATVIKEEENNG